MKKTMTEDKFYKILNLREKEIIELKQILEDKSNQDYLVRDCSYAQGYSNAMKDVMELIRSIFSKGADDENT